MAAPAAAIKQVSISQDHQRRHPGGHQAERKTRHPARHSTAENTLPFTMPRDIADPSSRSAGVWHLFGKSQSLPEAAAPSFGIRKARADSAGPESPTRCAPKFITCSSRWKKPPPAQAACRA